MAKPDRIELIARGLLVLDGHVLMCRNADGDYLYLPGGHVEFGEAAAAALVREFEEETGLDAVVGPLLAVGEERFEQAGRRRHEVNLVFHVERLGELLPTMEVPSLEEGIEFEWVRVEAVGGLRVLPASVGRWLEETGGEPGEQSVLLSGR